MGGFCARILWEDSVGGFCGRILWEDSGEDSGEDSRVDPGVDHGKDSGEDSGMDPGVGKGIPFESGLTFGPRAWRESSRGPTRRDPLWTLFGPLLTTTRTLQLNRC